ncbi:MAG: hypothetical protein KF916_06240 [Microbacteriaceae bacterium]|nr:hypothetical protein [Microbacteriaceae bacterium]
MFNQIYHAVKQFKRYQDLPHIRAYQAGRYNYIQYNPSTSCGGSNVYIQNQATAALYVYTPYQPNAASLAAGYGGGATCGAYGNRNFFNYYNDWFGQSNFMVPGYIASSWVALGRSEGILGSQ